MKLICILSTAPSLPIARKLAKVLIQSKLAACVNIIPEIESHYVWKGKLEKSSEIQLLIKTRADLFKKIESFLKKNHPYEVPELIQLAITRGSSAYFNWMKASTDKV